MKDVTDLPLNQAKPQQKRIYKFIWGKIFINQGDDYEYF